MGQAVKVNDAKSEHDAHPAPNYIGVFVTLMVLTIVTVGISRVNLGSAGNTALAIGVATIKGFLVALYFMHLKFETKYLIAALVIVALLAGVLVVGILPDVGYRAG